jgi:alpha-D-ribose 1-methylphosphonate 5-triphosphate diphosphatase
MGREYLTRARVVLGTEIVADAGVVVEDGRIAAIAPVHSGAAKETDLGGDLLLPGLVDLHCDALEKEIEPRPKVRFPVPFAIAAADRRNATAGITTVFHAVSFATGEFGVRSAQFAAEVVHAIRRERAACLVDNRIHCRYEITDPAGYGALGALLETGAVDLLSFMDHTPGQGQYKDPNVYRAYMRKQYQDSEEAIEARIEAKRNEASQASARVEELATTARRAGIAMASHDDDEADRIAWHRRLGVTISEFPVRREAAAVARDAGLVTVFGAPNVLRDASQSGSVRAREMVASGLAGALCSDYAPMTMLAATFALVDAGILDLPAAVRLVTANPAKAAGLADRGDVSVGKRADLVAVRPRDGRPEVVGSWVNGEAVLRVRG